MAAQNRNTARKPVSLKVVPADADLSTKQLTEATAHVAYAQFVFLAVRGIADDLHTLSCGGTEEAMRLNRS